ncbi:MAG: DUF1801 domain-containing protein [Bacteroidetes bacterium]|nr:MAG: DUF1801 domain-containing protein [Bacteroidota bacterium]
MTAVENLMYEVDAPQREIMLFLHKMFTTDYLLTEKVTFNNPCYYKRSWICYLRPIKGGKVELAFLRGNELSNAHGVLMDNGRKQLRSIEIASLKEINLEIIKETLSEAIYLDETTPYAPKRKPKGK